ncbi:MAG TPA: hypothetical protein VEZ90_08855, partial [Blastocatellia bacterium]|nr:hypothetical protein [Blastocatellia bacterium]
MKRILKKAPARVFVAFVLVGVLLLMSNAPSAQLKAQSTTPNNGGGNFVHFNNPPFDFNDNFYTANGIDVTMLDSAAGQRFGLFRQFGPPAPDHKANWVVDNSNTDPDRNNIRILATTGGYSDDGSATPNHFISIIAFITNQNFFTGVANKRGIQMSDIVTTFEAYAANKQILPNGQFAGTPCGTMGDGSSPCFPVTSVATPALRQDWRFAVNRSPIDLSSPFG